MALEVAGHSYEFVCKFIKAAILLLIVQNMTGYILFKSLPINPIFDYNLAELFNESPCIGMPNAFSFEKGVLFNFEVDLHHLLIMKRRHQGLIIFAVS